MILKRPTPNPLPSGEGALRRGLRPHAPRMGLLSGRGCTPACGAPCLCVDARAYRSDRYGRTKITSSSVTFLQMLSSYWTRTK